MKTAKKGGSSLMDKLKEEQERIKAKKESGGNFEKIDWYKPEEGDNLVRILPASSADELPFKTVRLHYIAVKKKDGSIVKGVPARCFEDFGDDCPLCAATKELYDGDEKSKEKAKDIRAREAYLYNIINFKDRKIQPYAAGITVHEEILTYTGDVGLEVFDVEGGHNWKITKKVDPRKPKNLGVKYSVRMDIKASDLPPKLKVLLENATDLDELYNKKEIKMVSDYLESIGFDALEDADEDDAPAPKTKAKVKAKAPVEEEEEEEEFEEVKPKAKAKVKAKVVEEEEEEEEFEEVKPKAKAKVKAKVVEEEEEEEEEFEEVKPKAKVKAKAKVEVEEEEEEFEDDEFESELRELGM